MKHHILYQEDINRVAALDLPWEKLANGTILITGASGLIGSLVIDVLMHKNNTENFNCTIYAVGRSIETAKIRFGDYWAKETFTFISHDINLPLEIMGAQTVDYVVHLASNTHPVAYATDPIGTITANIIGTNNLLKFASEHNAKRFAFASSNEIYGENRGDKELFDETYCGYIDSNTARAGYPESKRCGEALCQAYRVQNQLDVVIPRFTRTFGSTMLPSDTKAISQFIKKAMEHQDIVLKSEGNQFYSYTHVADAVSGFFFVLLQGVNGQAYNISDEKCDIRLKDLAAIIAKQVGKKVIFELPDEVEKSGYSTATKARLDATKLKSLGWSACYDIETGIARTLKILGND